MGSRNKAVSVVVLTYKPDKRKMFMTFRSILLQKNVDFQIVIADDGSDLNYAEEAKQFFDDNGFTDYTFILNPKNVGTVKNALSAMDSCKGQYIKLISPGDYLYGENTLAGWVSKIRKDNSVVCFSDTVHYHFNIEGKIEIISTYASPNEYQKYLKGSEEFRKAYLIKNDICCGASVLASTEKVREYLGYLDGKVILAEDNMYRLMAYKNEPESWYSNNSVLYEFGTGVSTGGVNLRVFNDWTETDNIMRTWLTGDDFDKSLRRKIVLRRFLTSILKIMKNIPYPKCLFAIVKGNGEIRYSPTECKQEYIDKLIQGI